MFIILFSFLLLVFVITFQKFSQKDFADVEKVFAAGAMESYYLSDMA
jgi:hypothetical protein